jgi:hypothetical protein
VRSGGEASCGLLVRTARPSLGLRPVGSGSPVVVCGNKWTTVAPAAAAVLCVRATAAEVACFCPEALAWHCAGVFLGESLGDGDAPGRRFPC